MQLGKTYYISVFIGNLDPNTGNVNFTDRCALFDVVPVTWYAYPVAAINGSNVLTCAVTSLALDGSNQQVDQEVHWILLGVPKMVE